MTISLTLTIDGESLRRILAARLRLVIAKPVDSSGLQVAWLAWTPFEGNRITWDETCGLYVAPGVPRAGSVVDVACTVPVATPPLCYPAGDAGFATSPIRDPHVRAWHYGVRNDGSTPRTFGLLQRATINGTETTGPVNVALVNAGYIWDFAADDTVHVWLARDVVSGTVVDAIPDGATTVRLDAASRSRTYRYDARTAGFMRCSSAMSPLKVTALAGG